MVSLFRLVDMNFMFLRSSSNVGIHNQYGTFLKNGHHG